MKQSKQSYSRRFSVLKNNLKKCLADAEFSDTASLRWGFEQCIVAHDGSLGFTIYFKDDSGEYSQYVSIVKIPYCSKQGLVGIFVRETDLEHMLSCIETALRDNFENIYVESIRGVE